MSEENEDTSPAALNEEEMTENESSSHVHNHQENGSGDAQVKQDDSEGVMEEVNLSQEEHSPAEENGPAAVHDGANTIDQTVPPALHVNSLPPFGGTPSFPSPNSTDGRPGQLPGTDQSSSLSSRVTSPSSAGQTDESFLQWSTNALKYTKQVLQEKLGRATRTIDPLLENRIENIRESQLRYRQMLDTTQHMIDGLRQTFQAQSTLGDMFLCMGKKIPELGDAFNYNSQTQKLVARNGEHLLAALEFFKRGLQTLSDKSTADCLDTVRKFEHARVEFDVHRREWELKQMSGGSAAESVERKMEKARQRYETLKHDVEVKMRLLDDNRNRVLQKHLLLFHNAVAAFFAGNQAALEATMRQFNLQHFTSLTYPDTYFLHSAPHDEASVDSMGSPTASSSVAAAKESA